MQKLSITWLGHSTFIVRTPGGKRILFDPWLSSNPSCPDSMKKPPKVDVILASHVHFDHIEDLVACARESVAPVVGVFGDMKLIGEMYTPAIAFLPIGDRFTMDPMQAARACQLLGVRQVVPMHWGTFPLLTGTPAELRKLVEPRVQVLELKPGETTE